MEKIKKGWFICAVTVGYEQRVYQELKKFLTNDYYSKYIYDIFLPMTKTKNKKGERVAKLAYNGIIYINMTLTDEVYDVINIDGFRRPLPPKEPFPVPDEQMKEVFKYRIIDED